MAKILIVEDESSIAKALKLKLTEVGHEVLSAKDGKEGLEVALALHPSLILLDILMPNLNGEEMLAMLRKDDWGKDVAVIVLTNFSDDERVERCVALGARSYLIKTDWKIEDIVTEVENNL